jgi:hypothetical protein
MYVLVFLCSERYHCSQRSSTRFPMVRLTIVDAINGCIGSVLLMLHLFLWLAYIATCPVHCWAGHPKRLEP